MATGFDRIHSIGVYEQRAMLRVVHPAFDCTIAGALLACRGMIRPTEVNGRYRVRIEYRVPHNPEVFVEDPPLRQRDGEKIPHTYLGVRPCLFLPGSGEWRSDKYLAHTVVPWLSEWLFYYELWHATGEWMGGGVHPSPRDSGQRRAA